MKIINLIIVILVFSSSVVLAKDIHINLNEARWQEMTEEDLTKKPYDYVTKDNFDIVRGCIVQGLTFQKKPADIVADLMKVANFPESVARAIVSQEGGGAFDEWSENGGTPIK